MSAPSQVNKVRQGGDSSRSLDSVTAVLDPLAERLNSTPIMGAAAPSWIRPTYANDFVDLASLQQTAFHRDALGYTHFKLAASSAAGVAANASICTLDKDYRPAESTGLGGGFNGSTNAVNPIAISTAGVVTTRVAIAAGESVVGYFVFLAVF